MDFLIETYDCRDSMFHGYGGFHLCKTDFDLLFIPLQAALRLSLMAHHEVPCPIMEKWSGRGGVSKIGKAADYSPLFVVRRHWQTISNGNAYNERRVRKKCIEIMIPEL